MTTIIRIKRLRQEEPVDAVVLACKRKKTEDVEDEVEPVKTILKLSGTVSDKDDTIAAKTVGLLNKSKELYKIHVPNLTAKNRQDRRAQTENSRFKVLSCLRAATDEAEKSSDDSHDNYITIVDVKKETDDEKPDENVAENNNHYVYDLYHMYSEHGADQIDVCMDYFVCIQPLASDLQYRCGEDFYNDDDDNPEDDDSNDETNWRNDYPDSDHSIDEDDMRLAAQLRGFGLDDGYDLSGDTDEEQYLNYGAEERELASGLAGDSYARYKTRVTQELEDEADDEY